MSEFVAEIRRRTDEARQSLATAHREGDDYLVAVREGELDELARLAADNDVIDLDAASGAAPAGSACISR